MTPQCIVLTTEMFSTPLKPFYLPSYIEGLAQVFAKASSLVLFQS